MKFSILPFCLILVAFGSCDDSWLDVKRDRGLIVPVSLKDMDLLLKDEANLSKDHNNLIQLSADDYYIPAVLYEASSNPVMKNSYVWAPDIYEGTLNLPDWDKAYAQILVANVILDGLTKIIRTDGNGANWDRVKGSALHLRGKALYILAQTFAAPFDAATAETEPGIPVRTSPDPNAPTIRASVGETYERIIADLEEAAALLPAKPEFIMDPSAGSAHGWLARCYLSMGNYEKALEHADAYLAKHNELLDFNTLSSTASYPIPKYNVEIIQHSETSLAYSAFLPTSSRVPNTLYNLYDANDLRRVIFFRNMATGELGTWSFRGSYTGSPYLFSGIATDELFLIRAECNARLGNVAPAMDDLNKLLTSRWASGTFSGLTAVTPEEALRLILLEREKELLRRGVRWPDLRRLNKEPAHAISIKRNIDGNEYVLPPGDPRYVLPIPQYIIDFTHIEQNPR